MKHLAYATIAQLRQALEKKEISGPELLSYFINRFATYDKQLGSALEIFDPESILARYKAGSHQPLGYIPGIIKDNICQQGRITACASKILYDFVSPYDATAIERLKNSGALMIGRANCDEFAMGSSTETSAYQLTHNPWNMDRVPGGSSGGSVAAVAAGLVPWALGSETGGSVRLPAALCGIVGSKPTYGLVSRYGLVAYGSSLDQIGVATRTVYDNALVLSLIAGHDPKDSTSRNIKVPDYTKDLTGKIKPGLTIGIIENAINAPGIDPQVQALTEQAVQVLQKLGATVKRVTLPTMDYAAAVYFIVSRAEAASNLARFDGIRYGYRDESAHTLAQLYAQTRGNGFGQEVRTRIMVGNYVLSAGHAGKFYENACRVRRLMRAEFANIFKEVDILCAPTQGIPAFKFGAFDEDKLGMDLQDYFTACANLADIPALSLPAGFTTNGLPIGFQLMGPYLSEGLLFQTGHAYEQATEWHTKHPQEFA